MIHEIDSKSDYHSPGSSRKEDHDSSNSPLAKPEVYYGMSFENIHKDLILSLDTHGIPLSRLSDLTWVLTQFKLVITDNVTFCFEGLLCDKPTNPSNIQMTQIFFLMRVFSNKGTFKTLRAGSLTAGFYSLLYLCKYADEKNILIKDIFHRPEIYKPMLEGINHQRASVLWQILRIFNITKCPSHWFAIPNQFMKDLKKIYKGIRHISKNQHPVIPPRILNLRWIHYFDVLNDFQTHRDKIEEFIRAATANCLFARGFNSQYRSKKDGKAPTDAPQAMEFHQSSFAYGLSDLFIKYKVENVVSVPRFLMLVQYCAKSLIHILTLMRKNEALLLERNCVDVASGWCEQGVYVIGISTKATGQPIDTKWITVEEVNIPLKALNQVFDIIHPYLDSKISELNNLFLSPTHIGLSRQKNPPILGNFDSAKFEYQLPEILITEEDLVILELISPERDWRSEENFKIGNPWKITSHQFRRTMSVYCSEDSLMEIGPLKRVLGHLSKLTSEHYQKGCSVGVFKMQQLAPEIVAEFKRAAIDASGAIYIRNILYSEEALHGLQGRRLQASKDSKQLVLRENLDEVIERKRKGLISCTITPIGLCRSIEPCLKRAHADFSTCDGCKEAVIKTSKLDYVIDVLRHDLKALDPNSFDYKMDSQNLHDLEDMRTRLLAKAETKKLKPAVNY